LKNWNREISTFMADVTGLLGGPFFKSMFMPAVPTVGIPAGIKLPEDPNDTEVDYYCHNVGNVRMNNENSPGDVMDLKDYGITMVTRAIVVPMVD